MYRFILALLCAAFFLAGCSTKQTKTGQVETPVVDPGPEPDIKLPPGPQPQFVDPEDYTGDPAIKAEAMAALRDMYFAHDSASIMPNEEPTLQAIGAFMKKRTQVAILVEGHCDERGTEEYNMALGSRRANAAREYLVRQVGIDSNRLFPISYGEIRPVMPGHDENAWSRNRRSHFRIGQAAE
jgi:peptidoglycan-associated lipoprotein